MELKVPELEYGHIISHTFPGLFLLSEIVLAFSLFTPVNIFNTVCSINYKIFNILALFILIFILSTMLGIILDGVHHFIFEKWEAKNKTMQELFEIYEYISSIDQLQIIKQTIDKDYWYYYECYANIAIAMIPGILLFPIWFYRLGISLFFNICFLLVYLFIIGISIQQSLSTLDMVHALEEAFLKNFKNLRS